MNTDYLKYRIWDEEDKKYVSELVFINHCGEICLIENGALYRHKCTFERCTGIKDMYQNLIYQNDIVRTNAPCVGEPELKVIRWEDCYAGYLLTACDFPSGHCDFYGGLGFNQEEASGYVAVIGNIHDEEK